MGRKRLYKSATERKRAQRARDRASAAHRLDAPARAVSAVVDHGDPVGELASWARQTLKVPAGHPRAGEPMELLAFAESWLRDSWGAHESALSTARKNAKSRRLRLSSRSVFCAVRFGGLAGAARSHL